jgi:hypothetical protein
VPFVATFGGSAFRLRAELDATPLMVFGPGSVVLLAEELLTPEVKLTPQSPRVPAEGKLQGVALVTGEGRVVVSGQAQHAFRSERHALVVRYPVVELRSTSMLRRMAAAARLRPFELRRANRTRIGVVATRDRGPLHRSTASRQ